MMRFNKSDLYAYAEWARSGLVDLGAVSAWYYIERGNVARGKVGRRSLSDEKADRIDKAVCELCNRDKQIGDIFIDHYLRGMSQRQIADTRKCPRTRVSDDLNFATGYVIAAAQFIYQSS